ncbi:MAG: winged helix-turn-helix domain-containing protein [Candidatus Heimdallarchaeum aukensis]|uniref:Winged helix-turn-helix domain-containing protein n=1 Tax=Candidatus Heimdallarchaeum aukensis TaxID=2876573 RepID=A0A9Y1BKT4_9ARCH|nr:MAG: winged helix-turn-helix domain-containing protein [Candidatus Heimdallarchaeum aukensis]
MSEEKDNKEKKDINIIKLEKGETVDLSKALGSSKRLNILKYTAEEELNLSEIAEKINSTPQAVYHHLQILEKSKLIRVVREEKIKNMDKTIKYYRSNFHPEAINLILWAPLENLDFEQLQERVPLTKLPIERIARKISNVMFQDKTEYKTDILTKLLEGLIDETHHSMQALKEEYGLELDEKLWNLMLLFSQLSTLNAFKKTMENEKLKKNFDDLVALLAEEMFEDVLIEKKEIE